MDSQKIKTTTEIHRVEWSSIVQCLPGLSTQHNFLIASYLSLVFLGNTHITWENIYIYIYIYI